MGFIRTLWRGEITLVFTYWVMGILVVAIFETIGSFRFFSEYMELWENSGTIPENGRIIFGSYIGIYILYITFISICIWNSADTYIKVAQENGRTEAKWWGYAAKATVSFIWILFLLCIIVALIFGFLFGMIEEISKI